MKKIPPSEKIRKGIEELLQGGTTENLLGRILHEGMRLIVQELYEGEADLPPFFVPIVIRVSQPLLPLQAV